MGERPIQTYEQRPRAAADIARDNEADARAGRLRRALRLEYFTIGWNGVEAVVGVAAGVAAGSVALMAFALDSVVEASSGAILVWRLRAEGTGTRTAETAERKALSLIALAFLALAGYVAVRSVFDLVFASRPDESAAGIALAAVSLVVMPLLARLKRDVAVKIGSAALRADSMQTSICAYLSAALLVGLAANAAFGWWWADPVAALVIAGFAAREGWELRRGDPCCD